MSKGIRETRYEMGVVLWQCSECKEWLDGNHFRSTPPARGLVSRCQACRDIHADVPTPDAPSPSEFKTALMAVLGVTLDTLATGEGADD